MAYILQQVRREDPKCSIEKGTRLGAFFYGVTTLQQDMLLMEPSRLTDWFTSGKQLSPSGYFIKGLKGLAVRNVPTHSVIGDRGKNDTPDSSDGVVPY